MSTPIAWMLNKVDAHIAVITGNTEADVSPYYTNLNLTSLQITPPQAEIIKLVGTGVKTKGMNLRTFEGTVTPEDISLAFNMAPPEIFAMALGAGVASIAEAEGAVVDHQITLAKGLKVMLPHANIEPATFELTAGGTPLVMGTDFELEEGLGALTALTAIAAVECLASYSYAAEKSIELIGGKSPTSRVRIVFSGINADNGKRVNGTIWDTTITPSNPIDFYSEEPVAPTLTGSLSKPADKEGTFSIRLHQ